MHCDIHWFLSNNIFSPVVLCPQPIVCHFHVVEHVGRLCMHGVSLLHVKDQRRSFSEGLNMTKVLDTKQSNPYMKMASGAQRYVV